MPNHLKEVESLLLKVNLPTEGVKENLSNFIIAQKENKIIGCAGIEIYDKVGLLRSVAINPALQGQGIGCKIMFKIEEFALNHNINRLYLLTETAEQFFHKLGYKKISRSSTEIQIQQTLEFTTLCPSAPVMVKQLAGKP